MKTNRSAYGVGLLLAILGCSRISQSDARGAVTNLNFVDAATALDDGPQDGVFDAFTPFNFGSVDNNGYSSFRTALEFDVSGIPPGSTIMAATLTLSVNFVEGTRNIALHGYAGDGTVQLADFSRDDLVDDTTLEPPGSQSVVFDVMTFIESRVAGGERFAGFNVREEPANSSNFGVLFFQMDGPNAPLLSLEFVPLSDADHDGVLDVADLCPDTIPGAVVDGDGCSIDQLVPCDGPASGGRWKNHGEYVSAVGRLADRFRAAGLITAHQQGAITAAAARSDCGKR